MGDKDRKRDRPRERGREPIPEKEGRDPHHELTNPADSPDPTEWPDPYEKRPDPRDPATVDTPAFPSEEAAGEEEEEDERADTPRSPSTSEPHPPDFDEVKPEKGKR